MSLKIGQTAPQFSLDSTAGRIALKDLRGRKVILFFYPADDTPTCTKEACAFRADFADLEAAGAVVLGISPDDLNSHHKFSRKFKLPFTLLADPDHAIAEKYGVWTQKQLFGHKYMGVERTTFVIDSQGRIAKIFSKVRVKGHTALVLEAVKAAL